MKASIGVAVLPALLLAAHCAGDALGSPPEEKKLGSFIFKAVADPSDKIRLVGEPYQAQPGDIVLFDDHSKLVLVLYGLCGTSGPVHTGIVIRRPDGSMGLLEAGPNMIPKVMIIDLVARLNNYYGTLYVRRLRAPLAPEQCENLTQFALAQEGKPYAWGRLLLQGTPLRPRGPIGKLCLGKTYLNRTCWTCSELTGAAATSAGILDPHVHFANAMYPRDFAYDEEFNLRPYYYEMELWYPQAELRWVGTGVETGYPGPRKPLPK